MVVWIRGISIWKRLCLAKKGTTGLPTFVLSGLCGAVICQAYSSGNNGTTPKNELQTVSMVIENRKKGIDGIFYQLKQTVFKGKDVLNGITRFGHAAAVVLRIVIDYKTTLMNIDEKTQEYTSKKSACHKRSASKLRDLCLHNGGVFTKVGQHLGALDFLLPDEYVTTLRSLHNEASRSPFESVCQVVEEELGQPMHMVFDCFEEEPIGSASLAQVHRAVLKDGRVVAVKVQHKEVKAHAIVDLATVELLVKVVAYLFPEFRFQWLVEEMRRNIPLELDFIEEGKNCNKVENILRKFSFLKVPKIHWDYSSKRLLTMEFCEGGAIDDIDYYTANGISPEEVSSKLGRLYSEMIYVHGFIHCDPHPGNILVRKSSNGKAQIVLLDHGSYQNLTDNFRLTYCKLWQSLISGDIKNIQTHSRALGVGDMYGVFSCMLTGRSWDSINAGIQKVDVTESEIMEIQKLVVRYIPEITEVLNRVPRQMILIFKTNDLLRGLDSKLKTKETSSSFLTMLRCCVKAIRDANLSECSSIYCRACVYFQALIDNLRISLFQFSLSPVGKRTTMIWMSLFNYYTSFLTFLKRLSRLW